MVPLEDPIGLLSAGSPDGNPRVRSGRDHSPVPQEGNSVDGIGVKTKNLLRDFGSKRPPYGGGVETTGQRTLAIR